MLPATRCLIDADAKLNFPVLGWEDGQEHSAHNAAALMDERLKVIPDRGAFWGPPDDAPGANRRTKVGTYAMKQSAWAKEMAQYTNPNKDPWGHPVASWADRRASQGSLREVDAAA
ncbi:hypothetical protein DL768_006282 [Monosporascus sp. mg162]|nr:hypothetical protein DL768_006282 [Monosporascus sp. mg162]